VEEEMEIRCLKMENCLTVNPPDPVFAVGASTVKVPQTNVSFVKKYNPVSSSVMGSTRKEQGVFSPA
jgi:hypothetical protein